MCGKLKRSISQTQLCTVIIKLLVFPPSVSFICCYCCWSVTHSCLTSCDSMDCGTPGFPVLLMHHLLTWQLSGFFITLFPRRKHVLISWLQSSRTYTGRRDIIFLTMAHSAKAVVFPVVMYGSERCTRKNVEHWRIDGFELQCWRRLLRVFEP